MKDGPFCPPTTLHVTVTMVMGSLLSSFQTGRRSARLHRDRVSVGNFSGTVCFCRPQRETKRHQRACLPYPVPFEGRVEEVGLLERGCSYSDSGIMGSLLLSPFPQLLEVS
ncbi:hypothetical protein ATANTOWER_022852 [Ataeniobius toweri]|uniref:Uncharacterized protein n=1 Tax=Ataeniobius toweri TaxID=208326 RepID=A0ABU7BW68_9TELE|nr:hypothetical protein [Ataeniobius toweri]